MRKQVSFMVMALVAIFILQACAGIGDWFGGTPTPTNKPPTTPEALYPKDGDVLSSVYITFQWQSSDPEGGALTYDFYIAETGQELTAPYVGNLSKAEYSMSCEPGKSYHWKIVAKDSKGATSEGGPWTFSIEQVTNPPNVWDYLFAAAGSDKVAIFDLTRPNAIPYPQFFTDQLNSAKEIYVYGEKAYIINESGDIVIANMANYLAGENPETQVLESLGIYPIKGRRIQAADLSGVTYLLIGGEEKLFAYNVNSGNTPVPYDGLRNISALGVSQGNTVFAAGDDLSGKPSLVCLKLGGDGTFNFQSRVQLNFDPLDMTIASSGTENYVVLVGESGGSVYVESYSVTANNITPHATSDELGEIGLEAMAGISFHEDTLYVAAGNGGLVVFPISTLDSNLELTECGTVTDWDSGSFAASAVVRNYTSGKYAYVSSSDGLYVIDVDDSSSPQRIDKKDLVQPLYRLSAPQM